MAGSGPSASTDLVRDPGCSLRRRASEEQLTRRVNCSAYDRGSRRDAAPRWLVDSGGGSRNRGQRAVDRFLGWRRSFDARRLGNSRSHFSNDRTRRMVHRCTSLRQKTFRNTGSLVPFLLPQTG